MRNKSMHAQVTIEVSWVEAYGRKEGKEALCAPYTESLFLFFPYAFSDFKESWVQQLTLKGHFPHLTQLNRSNSSQYLNTVSVILLTNGLHSNSTIKGGLVSRTSQSSTLSSLNPKMLSNPNSSLPKFKESKILWLLKYHPGGNMQMGINSNF